MTTDLVMALAYAPSRRWSQAPRSGGAAVAEELADAWWRERERASTLREGHSRQWGGTVRS